MKKLIVILIVGIMMVSNVYGEELSNKTLILIDYHPNYEYNLSVGRTSAGGIVIFLTARANANSMAGKVFFDDTLPHNFVKIKKVEQGLSLAVNIGSYSEPINIYSSFGFRVSDPDYKYENILDGEIVYVNKKSEVDIVIGMGILEKLNDRFMLNVGIEFTMAHIEKPSVIIGGGYLF